MTAGPRSDVRLVLTHVIEISDYAHHISDRSQQHSVQCTRNSTIRALAPPDAQVYNATRQCKAETKNAAFSDRARHSCLLPYTVKHDSTTLVQL